MDFLFVKIMKVSKKYPIKREKLKKIESSVISTSMLLMKKYTTIFYFCCFSLGWNGLTYKFRGKEGSVSGRQSFFGNIPLSLIFAAFHWVGMV